MTITVPQVKTNPVGTFSLFATTTTPSCAITAPTDTTHYLVAILNLVTNVATITPNSGWSKAGSDYSGAEGKLSCLYRKVTGTEGASVTPATLSGTSQGDLTILEVAGLDQTTPFDQQPAGVRNSSTQTTISIIVGALANSDSLVVSGCRTGASDGGSFTYPAGGLTVDYPAFGGGSGHKITTVATSFTITAQFNATVTAIIEAWTFKGASITGEPKISVAGVETKKPLKMVSTQKPVKRWNGSSWVALT